MENKFFQKFSPGFFDLIVFDEAHRSYYDRQNIVFDYFDAIKIGLTATPRESETQSTIDTLIKNIDKATSQKKENKNNKK